MQDAPPTGDDPQDGLRDRLLAAALPNVAFDGWSEATLRRAAASTGTDPALARAVFPRGGVDLALAFHRAGDRAMTETLAATDLSTMRYSDRVAFAVRTRIEVVPDRELVRRGSTLFALPSHAADGARAIWSTADAIWRALGDGSTGVAFYTKRATLSAVYASAVLFWLGDDSQNRAETRAFIDRRISDVMQIEKLKVAVRDNPVARGLRTGPFGAAVDTVSGLARRFRPPTMPAMPDDLPGRMRP